MTLRSGAALVASLVAVGAVGQSVPTAPFKALFDQTKRSAKEDSGLGEPAEEGKGFHVVNANQSHKDHDDVWLEGEVEFLYQGYRVLCDKAHGNLATRIFELTGNVKVEGKDTTVKGGEVIVDFNRRSYRARDAASVLNPSLIKGAAKGPMYTKGRESFGTKDETTTYGGDVTTCDRDDPHFDIESDSTVVKPGRHAIMRKAKIKLFGRTLVKLPFLLIPLDDRSYKYLPEVGQSRDEGTYVKESYGIPMKGDNRLGTHTDYMSKLGTGLGTDYSYRNAGLDGMAKIYGITGIARTMLFSNQHRQKFNWGSLTLNNDYQKDNYLTAPGTTLLNTRGLLTIGGMGTTSDRFTFTRNSSETSTFSTVNETLGFSDSRSITGRLKSNVDLNWSSSTNSTSGESGSSSSKREQIDLRIREEQDLTKATASVEYQRTIPIGTIQNFYNSSDITPVLSLKSDSTKLFGSEFGKQLPLRSELSWGEYGEPYTGSRVGRSMFNLDFNKADRSDSRFRLGATGRFRQTLYSDDTAQYLLNSSLDASYSLGRDTSANIRYNYLRPYGYSPLLIDQSGRSNYISADLSARPLRSFLLGAQTGYDISKLDRKDTPWQQVGVRSEWTPLANLSLRGLYTYDTTELAWSNLRFDLNYRGGGQVLSIGSRYDGIRHVWSNVNVFWDGIQIGRTRFTTILNYNGYLKNFDSQQYAAVYDLHCAEALFTMTDSQSGFRTGKTFGFFLRLKAFPTGRTIGTGNDGQPLGTGTGRDF